MIFRGALLEALVSNEDDEDCLMLPSFNWRQQKRVCHTKEIEHRIVQLGTVQYIKVKFSLLQHNKAQYSIEYHITIKYR